MSAENLAPRDWSVETNVDVVKNAIRSYKAWRTKKYDILKSLINQHMEIKSHYTAISVQEAFKAYQHKQFNMEAGYAWLTENDDPNTATYDTKMKDISQEYAAVAREYYACLATAGGATNNDDAPGQGGNNKSKIRNDLKPKELKRDFTPMERTTWMRSFRHFFRASNMEKSPAQEQQANLLVCVEPSIATEIVSSVDENTPVYKPENPPADMVACMDVIETIFMHEYPILKRRCDFTQLRQDRGETMSQFILRVTQHANECDLNSMKLEDHLIMLAMIGTREEDLRSALYRLREPKWQEVKTVALDYERGRNTRVSSETAYYATRNQTKPKRGNFNATPQKKKQQCFRCGDLTHTSKDCKLPKSTICNKCNKKGHLGKICFGGKPREKSRLVTESNETEEWAAQIAEDEANAIANNVTHNAYVYRARSPPLLI